MRKKKTIVEETIPDENQTGTGVENDITDYVVSHTKVYKISAGDRAFCFQAFEPVDEVYIQSQVPSGGKFIAIEFNSLNEELARNNFVIEPKTLVRTTGEPSDVRSQMLMDELSFTRNMMLQLINGLVNKGSNGATGGTPLGELAQAMTMIHEISPKNNPVDLIIKGMEIGSKSVGGGGDWKAELVSAAKEVLPGAMQLLNTSRQPQPQQGQPMITTTPAAELQKGLTWIKGKIIAGMMPDLAVNWVILNANESPYNQILATSIQGTIDNFIALDAEIANEPYRSWFENAIAMLKEWYAEQSNDTHDNERGNGDGTDVEPNEAIGSKQSPIKKVV
jgi:hypothetical protein